MSGVSMFFIVIVVCLCLCCCFLVINKTTLFARLVFLDHIFSVFNLRCLSLKREKRKYFKGTLDTSGLKLFHWVQMEMLNNSHDEQSISWAFEQSDDKGMNGGLGHDSAL